jgi:hypothetical protein
MYPVFINNRDRLSPLRQLVSWLEAIGHDEITLVDNDSSYPPLLEYYERSAHRVVMLGVNLGKEAVWASGVLDEMPPRGPYVVTDPDIVPVEECPDDALEMFADVLERYPNIDKVGFGLKIDDLPDHYRFKEQVQSYEGRYWEREVEPGLYEAPIDTTFALHRAGTGYQRDRCLRTGPPYVARHTSWYSDSENLPEEELYYAARARSDTTHWTGEALPAAFAEGLARL